MNDFDFGRSLLLWLPLVAVGIGNGMLRELTYGKRLSELRAHQWSSVIGILFFLVASWVLFSVFGLASLDEAFRTGVIWVILTVGFEFVFGRFVSKHSWERMLQDYNILAGRLWLLVLLGIFTAPMIAFLLVGI